MGKEKLMVAVDFGTTYSGFAFCHANQKELTDIEVYSSWSGIIAPKTPTEIRYVPGRDPLWGAEAGLATERRDAANSAVIYNRFKLLLDVRGGSGIYRRSWLGSSSPSEADNIRLPRGKSAMDVSADYLRLLYKALMGILRRRIPETLDITPIHFIFTVPAIWGHQAQEATKWAAKSAGFCDRNFDSLSLVSEPEAAAMYVLKAMHEANFSRNPTQAMPSLKNGDTFVVCDAGGGTVDLISYEVEQVQPSFVLKEVVTGSGAKCGSSYIDEGFTDLLRKKIGPSFDDENIWSKKDIGRGSDLMNRFDSIKRSYGQSTNDVWYFRLPVNVPDDEENGILRNELEFTAEELKELFDPVVRKTIELVKMQVANILKCKKKVSAIFLVGGFGESPYLHQALMNWANTLATPIPVVNPRESWSAIMRGAIVRELNPAVRSRRLRRHYGFSCDLPFDPLIHNIRQSYVSVFGGRYAHNTVEWSAHMGDICVEDKEVIFHILRELSWPRCLNERLCTTLYGAETTDAPLFTHSPGTYRLGKIYLDFSSAQFESLKSAYEDTQGNGTPVKVYEVPYQVRMRLESADIKFSVWMDGKCIGDAEISYD
ncbi:hypothetical protein TWF481_009092 [Arthrobotrys musiformis]|uniref:Actin-like ATPase domain-containing protein n=1 Tax=Arthrobotrys musiformis TaxID=47236 RepID=A0AAV9W2T1_9PEZI